jgi:AcrR family transcriptional regulator
MADAKLDTAIRRDQIAEAALAVIAGQGLRRLSIAAVAHRVGLVPSGIYRHFKNKDALLDAVLDRIEQRLLDNVQASRDAHADPLECLKDVLMRHVRFLREGKVISVPRMIFAEDSESAGRKRRVLRLMQRYVGKIEEVVREGQASKAIRADLDASTIAMLLFGVVVPAGILWHLTEGGFDVTRHAQRSWRLFAAAVASPSKNTKRKT